MARARGALTRRLGCQLTRRVLTPCPCCVAARRSSAGRPARSAACTTTARHTGARPPAARWPLYDSVPQERFLFLSQMTRIGARRSWMTCLAGAVDETHYAMPPPEADPELFTPRSPAARQLDVPGVIASLAPCPPLRRGRTAQLLPGTTAYISDDIVRALLLCCFHRSSTDACCRFHRAGAACRGLRVWRRGCVRRRDASPVRAAHPAREALRSG
jgi:hypothetical protein